MPNIPRPNPELMVIGDSLAQGCRSLTVNQVFCAQSWPAQVAQAQNGWTFITPDFPRPVLFDLEQEIRRLNTLTMSVDDFRFDGIVGRIQDNLNAWLANARESANVCFDNLGLSGALIFDLYSRSATSSAAEIAQLAPSSQPVPWANLGDLHRAINARFALNPSQDPNFANYTPIRWVQERNPRRLIVQVGHNHGLYTIGSRAEDVSFTQPGDNGSHGDYWTQWQNLASALASLPPAMEILVALLPKVGAVANLEPREASRVNGYAPTYGPILSTSPSILQGTRLAQSDQAIQAANTQIQQIVTSAQSPANQGRLKFFDTYAQFNDFDFKNSLDPSQQIPITPDLSIDNRYVAGRFHLLPPNSVGWRLNAGGLQSVDGMHPSACGYTLLATHVIKLLGLTGDANTMFATAFNEDPLLNHYPPELRAVTFLLQMARDLTRTNSYFESELGMLGDNPSALDLLRVMHSTFFPN